MGDGAKETMRAYYDALRNGEPLHPFFAGHGPIVKVGIGERMVGAETVAEGLRAQTRTTTDWVVESRDLHVGEVGADGTIGAGITDVGEPAFAWFGDDVFVGWTDTERSIRFEFDTRWSGAMARVNGADGEGVEWRFVEMHVSTAGET